MSVEIEIAEDKEQVAHLAATEFVRIANESINVRKRFTVALSGGSTPRRLYELLADKTHPYLAQVDWRHAHFFWGDERCVSPDDAESNFRTAHDALLSRVPVPPQNIHRIEAERSDSDEAAQDYERYLRRFFDLTDKDFLQFDLVLLGLGTDGHTASLFPDSTALEEDTRLVVATWIAKLDARRITLTARAINHARRVVFLVVGADKSKAVRQVLTGVVRDEALMPAQLIRPEMGAPLWIIDRAAAQLL